MDDSMKYPILSAKRVPVKYGTQVQLELDNHIMFLPSRFNMLTDDEVKQFSSGKFRLQRKGERNLILGY